MPTTEPTTTEPATSVTTGALTVDSLALALLDTSRSAHREVATLSQSVALLGNELKMSLVSLAQAAGKRLDVQDKKLDEQSVQLQETKEETARLASTIDLMRKESEYDTFLLLAKYRQTELAFQLLPFVLAHTEQGKICAWPIQQRNRALGLLVHLPSLAQIIWLLLRTPISGSPRSEEEEEQEVLLAEDEAVLGYLTLHMKPRDFVNGIKLGTDALIDTLCEKLVDLKALQGLIPIFGTQAYPATAAVPGKGKLPGKSEFAIVNLDKFKAYLEYLTLKNKWIVNPKDVQAAMQHLELKGTWEAYTRSKRKFTRMEKDDLESRLGCFSREEQQGSPKKWTWTPSLSLSEGKLKDLKLNKLKLTSVAKLAHPVIGHLLTGYSEKQLHRSTRDVAYPVLGYPLAASVFMGYDCTAWPQVCRELHQALNKWDLGEPWTTSRGKGALFHMRGFLATTTPMQTFAATIATFVNPYRLAQEEDELTAEEIYESFNQPSKEEDGEESEESEHEDQATQEPDTQETQAQDPDTQDPDTQDPDTQDPDTQDTQAAPRTRTQRKRRREDSESEDEGVKHHRY